MTYISKEFTWRGCTKATFYFLFGVVFKDFAVTKVIIFFKLIPGLKYIRFEREFLEWIVVSTLNCSMRSLVRFSFNVNQQVNKTLHCCLLKSYICIY